MSEPADFLEQMQQMLQGMQDAQADLDSMEVVGTSGGGAVRVTASCLPELKRVEVTEEAVEDRDLLGDLIVVAVNDALRNAAAAAQERLGGLAGGLQLPGLDQLQLLDQLPVLEGDDDWEDDDGEEA